MSHFQNEVCISYGQSHPFKNAKVLLCSLFKFLSGTYGDQTLFRHLEKHIWIWSVGTTLIFTVTRLHHSCLTCTAFTLLCLPVRLTSPVCGLRSTSGPVIERQIMPVAVRVMVRWYHRPF